MLAPAPKETQVLLFLETGAILTENDERLEAPRLLFWPRRLPDRMRITAGTACRRLILDEEVMLDVIGARAESVRLRMLTEGTFEVPVEMPNDRARLAQLFDWIEEELARSAPSRMGLSACVRLVLITALRLQSEGVDEPDVPSILQRFRHLVERHYRDHWTVQSYCQELGIEPDRLARICKREIGRGPADLIAERLTAEAKARLEHAAQPLKSVAASLGFPDPSRFSHYFRRRTGMSPSAFRTLAQRRTVAEDPELRRGFEDWP